MFTRTSTLASAIAAAMITEASATLEVVKPHVRLGTSPTRQLLKTNHGTGGGAQRAAERLKRKRAWQAKFYARAA